jgi:hypothetical protein
LSDGTRTGGGNSNDKDCLVLIHSVVLFCFYAQSLYSHTSAELGKTFCSLEVGLISCLHAPPTPIHIPFVRL